MFGGTDNIDLNEMYPEPPVAAQLPLATIQDRSAKVSALTQTPDKLVSTYQTLVSEAQAGQDSYRKALETDISRKSANKDLEVLTGILASRDVTIENKKAALDAYNAKMKLPASNLNKEVAVAHLTQPTKVTKEEPEQVRDNIAELLDEVIDSQNRIQALVNGAGAKLQSESQGRTFLELLEVSVVPFANNVTIGKVTADLKKKYGKASGKDFLLSYLDAGGSMEDLRETFQNLPPKAREEFARGAIESLQGKSGVILSSDNDYGEYLKLISVFDPEGYSSTEKWLDRLSPILDLVGIGEVYRSAKNVGKLGKTPRIASNVVPTTEPAVPVAKTPSASPQKAPESIFEGAKVSTPDVELAARQKAIQELEAQRASTLGDSSPLLDNGQVRKIYDEMKALEKPVTDVKARAKEYQTNQQLSYKEAVKRAEKDIADEVAEYEAKQGRLQGLIDNNASAAKNEQRLAELDKQITELKKGMPSEAGSLLTEIADSIRRIDWNTTVHQYNPAAMANIMATANPSNARMIFKAVNDAPDDELARAMYGSSKQDAVTSNLMPQAITPNGPVIAKLTDADREVRQAVKVDEHILDTIATTESIGLTKGEKAAIRANIVNDFRNAEGLEIHPSLSSFAKDDVDGKFRISAVYGTADGGFADAAEAVMQAKFALRRFGVNEDQITLLQRVGAEFREVDKKNIPDIGPGEYHVRVDINQGYDITDISGLEHLTTKMNLFDSFSSLVWNDRGSAARFVADPATMIDPALSRPISAGADRTSRMEKYMLSLANEYAEEWKALPKQMQQALNEYLIKANFNGIKPDVAHMISEGLDAGARNAVAKWRKFWDTHYNLENLDVVRTMRNEGYEVLESANAKLYGKKISKNRNIDTVYDPTIDQVRAITGAEIDDLYDVQKGSLVRLRRPETINGQVVEYIVSRERPTEYMRGITSNDSVLNYREGYFQVQYKAARFVDEVVVRADGTKYTKAIAVAGDSAEADHFVKRMQRANPGVEYRVRSDERAMVKGSNDWWDVNGASGRIAQRHRGKTLEDSSGLNHLGDQSYIVNPAEAAVKAARSISGRTMMRPMLEQAKARWVNQFGDFVQTVDGQKRFPMTVEEINAKGIFTTKEIRDARTNWEYIRYIENGYLAAADQMTRQFWNYVAEVGRMTRLPSVERFAQSRVEGAGISSLAKNAVFMATIATNPLRQLVIQPNQVLRLFAYTGFKGDSVIDIIKTVGDLMGEVSGLRPASKQHKELMSFIEESGLLSAVDRSNLVRGALTDSAQLHGPVKGVLLKPINFTRRWGFDLAEQGNLAAHLIAAYRKYEKKGFDMKDPDVRVMVQAEARAISYEMNFAGDMPYNQGSLSFAMQFLQVPHKAFLQYTNRKLDAATRMRLAAADLVFWGPPTALVSALISKDLLPPDGENKFVREAVIDGLQSAMLNKVLKDIGGEDQGKVDFSSLDPHNIDGWIKFYDAIMTGGVGDLVMNSPSGSMFLKDGGRLPAAIESMSRWFNGTIDEEFTAEELIPIFTEIAKISSGFNNAWKAKQMLDMEKSMDAKGGTIDQKATKLDALAQLFGFTNYDRNALIKMSMEVSKDKKKAEEEAIKQMDAVMRYYTQKLGEGNTDVRWIQNVGKWIVTSHQGDPEMQKLLYNRLRAQAMGPDSSFMRTLMKASGHPDMEDMKAKIELSGLTREQKDEILRTINSVQSYKQKEE
jgi:hypothetical protein